MKANRPLVYWFLFLALLLGFSMFLVSCKPAQEVREQHRNETVVNRAMTDSVRLSVGKVQTGRPDCDSVAQVAFDRMLSMLSMERTSGNNRLSIDYDRIRKMIVVNTEVGETTDTKETKHFLVNRYIAAQMTKEEKFNLWAGRAMWLLLFGWIAAKIGKRFL